MEKLVALCYLWAFGLGEKEDYYSELDRLFLEDSEDDYLLELEGLSDESAAALTMLSPLAEGSLNVDNFGKELFTALEKVYNENRLPLAEFGECCYKMWGGLPYKPYQYEHIEPFLTLTYATDPLSYGNKGQSRDLFEDAFNYYKEKK